MSDADFQLQGLRDPRLAVHAMSGMPAWLWSIDGSRILWSNPSAARAFGARNAALLANKAIGPADPHRRQVTQLASRLAADGAARLERLQGFGASLGRLMTCACSRLTFSDGTSAILVVATESGGRTMPVDERLSNLLESIAKPALAFKPNGAFAAANDAAENFSQLLSDLSSQSADIARATTVRDGTATLALDFGEVSLHRIGTGNDTRLVATTDAAIPEPVAVPIVSATTPSQIVPTTTDTVVAHATPNELQQTIAPLVETATTDRAAPHWSEVTAAATNVETPPRDLPSSTGNDAMPADVFESVFDDVGPAKEAPSTAGVEMPTSPLAPEPTTDRAKVPVHDAQDTHNSNGNFQKSEIAANGVSATLAQMDGPPLSARRHPLRFMWQMDPDSRFSLGSDEFSRLIGTRTAAAFGRLWSEIADVLGLDPEGRVASAIASRDTWSGIVVNWPADDSGARLPVELSGLPLYDHARNFIGYRGFGVCRDIEGLARLSAQRRDEVLYSSTPWMMTTAEHSAVIEKTADILETAAAATATPAEPEPSVDTPQNVVPFRAAGEAKSPTLTVGESNAFDELARRLSAKLDGANDDAPTNIASAPTDAPVADAANPHESVTNGAVENSPAFLQPETTPPRVVSAQDSQLLDRLPVGILVYRLDRLIYANRAFLDRTGFESLHALTDAGGLDALFVEPGVVSGSSTSEAGTPVMISATGSSTGPRDSDDGHAPLDAKLFAISWDNEPALALMFSGPRVEAAPVAVRTTAVAAPSADLTHAEELSTILDITAEGIVMFDGLGRIVSCNRSAEALFGRNGSDMAALNLIDLFAPESQRSVLDYLESVKATTVASLLDHGRDMLGRVRDGGAIPLSMTMGRTRPDSARFFAVFRDMSQMKKNETDLLQARRQAERATIAKAEVLGRISHEVRTPLNAIIGFADVMIGERFGALGNERYVEYMKDIRASGQRVMSIIDDLLDLSRIESGKMELSFANQDLNNLVEQCVAVMQPQANRERIIIRTSLAHALPSVKADARALRQIAMNLIGSSIHLANAGGQVIVSTATTDFGDIVLRVRDTGPGLNDNEIAAAMAPFRTPAANDSIPPDNSGVSLSLTKALVEANRARFNIKTAPHSGTLIEVVFSHASAIA